MPRFKLPALFLAAVSMVWACWASPADAALFRRPARRTWHANSGPSRPSSGYPAPRTYNGRTYYYGAPGYLGPAPRPGGPVWARYLNEPFYMHPERKALGILP